MKLHRLLGSLEGVAKLTRLDLALDLQLRPLVQRMARCHLEIDLAAEATGRMRWVLHVMGRRDGSIIEWHAIPIPTEADEATEIVIGIYLADLVSSVRAGLGRIKNGLDKLDRDEEPDDVADLKVRSMS